MKKIIIMVMFGMLMIGNGHAASFFDDLNNAQVSYAMDTTNSVLYRKPPNLQFGGSSHVFGEVSPEEMCKKADVHGIAHLTVFNPETKAVMECHLRK